MTPIDPKELEVWTEQELDEAKAEAKEMADYFASDPADKARIAQLEALILQLLADLTPSDDEKRDG